MNELVSVIIPAYNISSYLIYSVDCVRKQTYHNLEIILVDDGSSDNTLSQCQRLANKDTRIKVIHQPNGGVSSARNTGLDAAQGEYIIFVDGDDIVAPYYVEKLIYAVRGKALSMCMHVRINDYNYNFQDTYEEYKSFSAEECAKRLIEGNFPVCVWGLFVNQKSESYAFLSELEIMRINSSCIHICLITLMMKLHLPIRKCMGTILEKDLRLDLSGMAQEILLKWQIKCMS